MTRWAIGLAFALACTSTLAACGDDDGGNNDKMDGGGDGDMGDGDGDMGDGDGDTGDGDTGDGDGDTGDGDGDSTMEVMCGGETCAGAGDMGAAMGITACCTDDEACGLNTPLNPGMCFPEGAPGSADLGCPSFDVMGLTTWDGCCTPDGECGANAGDPLGCIPNSGLGATEQSCNYDPNNVCDRIMAVECDGPEDCGSGQQCCGEFTGLTGSGGYRALKCADSCADLEAAGGIWSEICHPGMTCEDEAYMCLANTDYLPDYLFRCRDTGDEPASAGSTASGEINCGDNVCGSGEKCCVSYPGEPHCVDENEDCTCYSGTVSDGGTDDAGN